MPIFRRKRSVDPAELEALRSELAGVRALLASAVASRHAVEQRLSELESAREAQAPRPAVERSGVLPPPPPSASLDEVKAIAEHAAQLAARADEGVKGLNELVASGAHQPAVEPPEVLEALQAQVAQLAERVSAAQAESHRAHELATFVDARLTQLGSELNLQLDELAGEIEDVRQMATTSTVGESAAIEQLRQGQVRLACEQARYEISFREQLAQLADQLRRSA